LQLGQRRKDRIGIALGAGMQDMELQAENAGRLLHVSGEAPGKRIGGIEQQCNGFRGIKIKGDGDAAKDERGIRSRESDRAELTSFQTFAPKIPRVPIRATPCGPYWLGLTTLFGS
jgi:hypothetical protein